eukprot:GHVO01068401.1.p1 GENE.GHVO01068401.1~~GHVO01068401.1.p1  ORF type:complete len:142 (+),score=5.66 GHVO01068401.1:430-855(+)
MVTRAQLHWPGRMGNELIPKALSFGQLERGKISCGRQRMRYRDVLRATMKAYGMGWAAWEGAAINTSDWRKQCHDGCDRFEAQRTANLVAKHAQRHAAQSSQLRPAQSPSSPISAHVCPVCQRRCASRIGLYSHRRHHHPP